MIAVTKLIDILNKPFLVYWANNLGLKGKNLRTYYKETQSEGNANHNNVEQYLKYGIKFNGWEKLENSLHGYEVIGTEIDVSNGCINGRIDLVLRKNERLYIVDFKRNKEVYLSTKLQLSTYKYLYDAHEVAYINSEDLELKILKIDTDKYFNIIKKLYQIHLSLTELNEKL